MVAVLTKVRYMTYNHKFESYYKAKAYIKNVKEMMPEAKIQIFEKVNVY